MFLIAGLVGMMASFPGQTVGVSAFTDALIESLSLTRVHMSLAYLIGTISSALLLTPAGRLYDRLGSRVVGSAAAVGLGLSLLALTRAPQLSRLLASGPVGPAVSALVVMSAGFFLIRFWGQGMMTLVGRTMIMKWFDDKRGAANAVLSIGIPLSFAYAPQLLDTLINQRGWQGTWFLLGLILVFGIGTVALLTFRDPPYGRGAHEGPDIEPDDGPSPAPTVLLPAARVLRRLGLRRTSEPMRPSRQYTLREALRSWPFWIFNGVITLSSMLITGFTFHVVGVMAEAGIGRSAALAVLFPAALVSVSIQPLGSVASDYMRLKYFAIVHGLSLAVFLLSLLVLRASATMGYPLLVASKGIAMAMFGINHVVVWPRFYGTRNLGAISGFNTACMVAGSAVGPYVYSLFEATTGSFAPIAWFFAPIAVLFGVAAFFADNPNRA